MSSVRERLPRDFICRMQEQLGREAEDFFACYDEAPRAGIRINSGKISADNAALRVPFAGERIPWVKNGYYTDRDAAASRHPYYYAGLYYIQEPSAMLPASRLPIMPGDKVLDLCAAPGGKTTELASRLNGSGLLVANDASASRAKALVKNLTVWGTANICITAEQPRRLLETFGCFFDKILVDAPCSGEGMFRKDPALISSWKEKGPEAYAPLQKEILSCAVQMLKPGGMLLYSTCTFSEEEDEAVIADALRQFPEMELLPQKKEPGFADGIAPSSSVMTADSSFNLSDCVRIYPHRVKGEGHFLALLKKKSETDSIGFFGKESFSDKASRDKGSRDKSNRDKSSREPDAPDAVFRFLTRISESINEIGESEVDHSSEERSGICVRLRNILSTYRYEQIGEQCLLVPPYPLPGGIRYLRTGLLLGTLKRDRFEPCQALAMMLDASCFDAVLDLSCEDGRVLRYLKGETLDIDDREEAFLSSSADKTVLVCVDGHGLGWGKLVDGSIRNKFYPGWRML